MRAAIVTDDHRLVVEDRPEPEPAAGEVLVGVHGAGLNRADLVQLAGRYPAPPGSPADIPGLEFAGEVVGLGAGVTTWSTGDRVFGIAGGGGQAELLTVPAAHCVAVPAGIDLVTAGGIPEVFVTAHDAMVTQAGATAGDTVLVHAVGSGVGTAAVQLGTAIGVTTVGTARTADKLVAAEALGLDHAVVAPRDFDPRALTDAIADAAGPIDVVLELVGGGYLGVDVRVARRGGRIVVIGTLAGTRTELDVALVMVKRLHIIGTVLRARDHAEKAAATAAFARDVVPLLADGTLAPVIAATFPLADAAAAYDLLDSDTTFGKVILDLR